MFVELVAAAMLLQERAPNPVCQAHVQWAVTEPRSLSRSAAAPPTVLSVFSAASPTSICIPAELTLSVAYYRGDGELLCSGTLAGIARHESTVTQVTALEIRAGNLIEFARWRNAGRNLRQSMPLTCMSLDGTTEVPSDELVQARTLRLWVTVATRWMGVATDELILTLAP
jgi:hypothetical protein